MGTVLVARLCLIIRAIYLPLIPLTPQQTHARMYPTFQGPARNRMLVKGGSSFNALVRAMKQDLIESGSAQRSPALLYEIDKVRGGGACMGGLDGACTSCVHLIVL
jgi:hypothetical protein